MPPSLQLANSDTAALFSIDWTPVTGRVAAFKALGSSGGVYILGALEGDVLGPAYYWEACNGWAHISFPLLTAHSAAVAGFCPGAIRQLQTIQTQISGLDPNAPLPADKKQAIQAQFQSLAQLATGLRNSSAALGPLITQFLDVSDAFDAKVAASPTPVAKAWTSLTAAGGAIRPALQRALGAWQAIADDLAGVASDRIPMTTGLLLSLEIDSALRAWSAIGAEASQFKIAADAQQSQIAGEWILRAPA
jgi:hypothetical protein